jgi:hypothetical protein
MSKPAVHLVITRFGPWPEEYYVRRVIIRRRSPGAFTAQEYPRITWCGDWFDGDWPGHWTADPRAFTCKRCRTAFNAKI